MIENLPLTVKGRLIIRDTTDPNNSKTLVDKHNAVHPQNMARAIARAFANESNYWIESMAFGNGGTFINVSQAIQYKTVNDGQPPDTNTWDSRPYNETYREIVQEGNPTLNPDLGTDPGSGNRPGGGAVPSGDPPSVPNVSGPGVRSSELGLTSEVIVTCVLNPGEPTGQFTNDSHGPVEDPESSFMFDEIALFTAGAPNVATAGTHSLDVGNRTATDDTGLTANTPYSFHIAVDGGTPKNITFTTPAAGGSGSGGEILYGDLVKALRTAPGSWSMAVDSVPVTGVNPLPGGASVNITNDGTFDITVPAEQTYGYLRFKSGTTGATSSVTVSAGTSNDLLAALNPPSGAVITPPVNGKNAGVQNDPVNPLTERERMLTHVIFSPVLKAANRTLTITYILTIAVARTV